MRWKDAALLSLSAGCTALIAVIQHTKRRPKPAYPRLPFLPR